MKSPLTAVALAGIALVCTTGTALAQGQSAAKLDFGAREYKSGCAVCHGVSGKGDGPYKPFQTKSPSDLTTLAKANNGVFPYQRVYEIVDGRLAVGAHGPRDMPIWGTRYLTEASGYYMDVPYDPEVFVRTRITALVDYVYRLQAK